MTRKSLIRHKRDLLNVAAIDLAVEIGEGEAESAPRALSPRSFSRYDVENLWADAESWFEVEDALSSEAMDDERRGELRARRLELRAALDQLDVHAPDLRGRYLKDLL